MYTNLRQLASFVTAGMVTNMLESFGGKAVNGCEGTSEQLSGGNAK